MSACSPSFNFSQHSTISTPSSFPNQYDLPSIIDFRILGYSRSSNFESTSSLKLIAFHHSSYENHRIRLKCVRSEPAAETIAASEEGKTSHLEEYRVVENESDPRIDGDGSGGNGGANSFGGGGDENGDGDDEKEFGPILKFEEVMKETEDRGVTLPSDMLEAAKTTGIREVFLLRYLELQGSGWPLGFLMKYCSILRNRMLADPSFLFKVGTEIVIDSCCATFAEVQKRGKDFWAEFELYAADLLVGVVVDIALVGMLAPYARIGQRSMSTGLFGKIQHACAALPSSVFEAERPGCKFTVKQRIATYFYKILKTVFGRRVQFLMKPFLYKYVLYFVFLFALKLGVLYGSVGFGCGLVGQGIANFIMNAKRSLKKSEEDIPVPPLVQSAVLWGVFLAVSSNTRYQIVNGLEHLVEASPMAKRVPPVAMAFTVGVRFANNIYGGMQFVDWAKWSGVQ